MATNIKTRILLRNDALSSWEAVDSVALAKGEVGIANIGANKYELRVGGAGGTTWANSRKLELDASQISNLIEVIQQTVGGDAKQYRIQEGEGNSWTFESAALSGGDWTTEATLSLDYDEVASQIGLSNYALSADVTTLVATVSADTLIAANGYTDGQVEALSGTIDGKFLTQSDFSTISTTIGLDAANADNKVVTLSDIADLTGAMHFRGAITPQEGETDQKAIARVVTDPEAGDVVVITTTSKEYLYSVSSWIELGDEDLYAKKTEVEAAINGLSAATSALVGTVSADTLTEANEYTNGKIAALSAEDAGNGFVTVVTQSDGVISVTKKTIELSDITDYSTITETFATKDEVEAVSVALSTDYVAKIKDVDDKLADYALSADVNTLVQTVSADTLTAANDYTDDQVEALSGTISTDYIRHGEVVDSDLSGFFVLDCGGATLRSGEPAANTL